MYNIKKSTAPHKPKSKVEPGHGRVYILGHVIVLFWIVAVPPTRGHTPILQTVLLCGADPPALFL